MLRVRRPIFGEGAQRGNNVNSQDQKAPLKAFCLALWRYPLRVCDE